MDIHDNLPLTSAPREKQLPLKSGGIPDAPLSVSVRPIQPGGGVNDCTLPECSNVYETNVLLTDERVENEVGDDEAVEDTVAVDE